ncbi:MAG: glycosyltransferase [Phototrophicaceae bacterium]
MHQHNPVPAISVVMAVYNGEAFIARAIDSILAQTFRDFECIIIDDGSSDTSPDILQTFASNDDRIRIITNTQNIGLTQSLNKGIAHSRGEFIARHDADDVSYPTRFEQQIALLHTSTDLAFVTSDFHIKSDGKQQLFKHAPSQIEQRWLMLFLNHISGHTGVMIRRTVLETVNAYDTTYRYAQDYDLWARIIEKHTFGVIHQALFCMYFHDDNISMRKLDEQQAYALQVSQRQIEALIGTIPQENVKHLFLFWTEHFDVIPNYQSVMRDLVKIWVAFKRYHTPSPAEIKAIKQRMSTYFWRAAQAQTGMRAHYCLLLAMRWSMRRVLHMTIYRLQVT